MFTAGGDARPQGVGPGQRDHAERRDEAHEGRHQPPAGRGALHLRALTGGRLFSLQRTESV